MVHFFALTPELADHRALMSASALDKLCLLLPLALVGDALQVRVTVLDGIDELGSAVDNLASPAVAGPFKQFALWVAISPEPLQVKQD